MKVNNSINIYKCHKNNLLGVCNELKLKHNERKNYVNEIKIYYFIFSVVTST
jgi:hypothetical protein